MAFLSELIPVPPISINFLRWLAMLTARRSLARSRFRLFDSSGSGRLSLRDLRKAVKEAQLSIKEHEPLGAMALGGADISGMEAFFYVLINPAI